eukprot:324933_1
MSFPCCLSEILRSKWSMLLCAFFIMFTNSLVNISVKSTTNNLRSHLNCTETEVQTFTVSAAYILSIPLSLYGSFIIHKVGTSKSLVLWTATATVGWIIFAIGVWARNLVIMFIGRFLQGGAFGAMRVSFNAFCVKWFGKKHIAMSMGILRSAHNIAHVVGSILVINVFQHKWKWTLPQIFWSETLPLIGCTFLAILMWLSAKSMYKIQEELLKQQQMQIDVESQSESQKETPVTVPKKKKTIVFPTEGQVTVTKDAKSKSSFSVGEFSTTGQTANEIEKSGSESSIRSASYNIEKLGAKRHIEMMGNHLNALFKNAIFVIIIMIGFSYDGTVVCFTAIVKRLLVDKFERIEEAGWDMGLTKYCGFAAPVAGYIIDRVRHREYWMLMAGLCLVFSTLSLYLCAPDDIWVMRFGLLGISFGQVCYGNSFWPAIASVAGRKYQIVAYGFMGAITSIGAVLLPQIYGKVTDFFDDVTKACLVFAVLSSIGVLSCIIIIAINSHSNIDYLNRTLSSKNNKKKNASNPK